MGRLALGLAGTEHQQGRIAPRAQDARVRKREYRGRINQNAVVLLRKLGEKLAERLAVQYLRSIGGYLAARQDVQALDVCPHNRVVQGPAADQHLRNTGGFRVNFEDVLLTRLAEVGVQNNHLLSGMGHSHAQIADQRALSISQHGRRNQQCLGLDVGSAEVEGRTNCPVCLGRLRGWLKIDHLGHTSKFFLARLQRHDTENGKSQRLGNFLGRLEAVIHPFANKRQADTQEHPQRKGGAHDLRFLRLGRRVRGAGRFEKTDVKRPPVIGDVDFLDPAVQNVAYAFRTLPLCLQHRVLDRFGV